MSRRYVNQLSHQEPIDQVFLAGGKQLRPNRNGNLYLQVELSDRGGSITARLWNADEDVYRSFDDGDYIHVKGAAQSYQGSMQIIAAKLHKVEPTTIDPADFAPEPVVPVDRLTLRLDEMLRGMENISPQNPRRVFFDRRGVDGQIVPGSGRAPKNHHAYHGGLLEHTVTLMEVSLRIAPCYPQLDRDLLLFGAFLHDLGKTDELSYRQGLGYTDAGQLVGHMVMAVALLDAKLAEAEKLSGEPVPPEIVLRLKHMILSHHGSYAFGSPKLPMTIEAVALAQLDNLDAKINAFAGLMADDPNVDSAWTTYNQNLERKLFKGAGTQEQPVDVDQ